MLGTNDDTEHKDVIKGNKGRGESVHEHAQFINYNYKVEKTHDSLVRVGQACHAQYLWLLSNFC